MNNNSEINTEQEGDLPQDDVQEDVELVSEEDENQFAQAADEAVAEDAGQVGDRDEALKQAEREVLRARAELENFRKRMQRESEQQLKYSSMPLMRDLLEVVDNLNRAIESAGQNADSSGALLEGVQMVSQQLSGVLDKHGCKMIESVGQVFDPNYHEAISQMPSDYEAGVVAQEVAAGYRLHDRVVRPSNVIVSTGPNQ